MNYMATITIWNRINKYIWIVNYRIVIRIIGMVLDMGRSMCKGMYMRKAIIIWDISMWIYIIV